MTTITLTSRKELQARRDLLTGEKRPSKTITVWEINGEGHRRDEWARSFFAAKSKAIADAVNLVRATGESVEVKAHTPLGDEEITIDADYVAELDASEARSEIMAIEYREENERRRIENDIRRQAAFDAAYPVALALGLSGSSGPYTITTDDTRVWMYVAGAGFDSRVALPNRIACERSILAHAKQSGWATVWVDGRPVDVASEMAHDSWCRKWLLGVKAA